MVGHDLVDFVDENGVGKIFDCHRTIDVISKYL
jgi:hypothetical protein